MAAFDMDDLGVAEDAKKGKVSGSPPTAALSRSKRPLDLVVWGANGYTGRLVCEYLKDRQGLDSVSWVAAGRSPEKVEALASELGVQTRVADSPQSLAELVSSTRVIISCAGPYITIGEDILALCVEYSVDYVDITGEAEWASLMVRKYFDEAKTKGIYIVPMCGMSASNDVGAYLAIRALGVPCKRIIGYRWEKGATSGGTQATGLETLRRSMEDKEYANMCEDPFVYGGAPLDGKVRPEDQLLTGIRKEAGFHVWLANPALAKTDTRQVRRSHELYRQCGESYGDNLNVQLYAVYPNEELAQLTLRGQAPKTRNRRTLLAQIAAMESAREKGLMLKPGEGHDQETAKKYYCDTLYSAEAERGSWAQCRVSLGDTFEITAVSAVESALTMVLERELMDPSRAGVVTPAFALIPGTNYVDRLCSGVLRENQLRIEAKRGRVTLLDFKRINKEHFGEIQ